MSVRSKKPRIALLGMGTLDAGALGIPVMIDLFGRLSANFDIVFYSFLPINRSAVPEGITVREPVAIRLPGRIKYILVGIRCAWDHLFNPYSLFFAVSVYPTAVCATILGRIFTRPSVVQLISTEGGAEEKINLGNMTIPWLKKITLSVCKQAHTVVAVADYQMEIAKKNLTTRRSIVVLPLRINPVYFPYSYRQLTSPVQFIQIGFYGPIKDQNTMFAAFAKVASKIDCHLTVVGDGFDIPTVHQLVADLKIADKLTFTGYIKNDKLKTYLERAHILLHTALFETGCAVIQEAMASGVAVCGTRVGILADIGERYAVIATPRDVDELSDKVLELINDPVLYESITQEAHRWITSYDAEWSHQNYLSFLNDVIIQRNQTYG